MSRKHLSVLVFFGVVFALLTPPFQSPDEPNHFFRAWQVSEGRFFPEKTDGRLGGNLPVSLSQVRDAFLFLKNSPKARLQPGSLRAALSIPLNAENRQFTDFANTAIYAPTAYLPQAAAIAILRPLGATPLFMLFAARITNLLCWVFLISAAIGMMPFLQNALSAVAMLPATLCIAGSANADVLTNGLCWWLTAALLAHPAAVYGKKLLATIVVAANKIIAVPIVLAGWLFGNDRRQRTTLLLAGLMAALSWGQLAQQWFIPYNDYNPAFRDGQTLNSNVDPARQMAFVLENPVHFAQICSKSLVKALPSMAAHIVGKFGWEKNYLHSGWIMALWIMLAALIFSEKNPLSTRQRWGLAGIAAIYVGAFALTMYMLWSAVGSENLNNWQGRYFMPILPLALLAISQGWLVRWKKQIDLAAFWMLILANMAMIAAIAERYSW